MHRWLVIWKAPMHLFCGAAAAKRTLDLWPKPPLRLCAARLRHIARGHPCRCLLPCARLLLPCPWLRLVAVYEGCVLDCIGWKWGNTTACANFRWPDGLGGELRSRLRGPSGLISPFHHGSGPTIDSGLVAIGNRISLQHPGIYDWIFLLAHHVLLAPGGFIRPPVSNMRQQNWFDMRRLTPSFLNPPFWFLSSWLDFRVYLFFLEEELSNQLKA